MTKENIERLRKIISHVLEDDYIWYKAEPFAGHFPEDQSCEYFLAIKEPDGWDYNDLWGTLIYLRDQLEITNDTTSLSQDEYVDLLYQEAFSGVPFKL